MTSLGIIRMREGLEQLASEQLQRSLWLSSGPLTSSFEEAVAATFDDSGLSDILDSSTADDALGSDVAELMRELAGAIALVDRTLTVKELIASEAMGRVRELADVSGRVVANDKTVLRVIVMLREERSRRSSDRPSRASDASLDHAITLLERADDLINQGQLAAAASAAAESARIAIESWDLTANATEEVVRLSEAFDQGR